MTHERGGIQTHMILLLSIVDEYLPPQRNSEKSISCEFHQWLACLMRQYWQLWVFLVWQLKDIWFLHGEALIKLQCDRWFSPVTKYLPSVKDFCGSPPRLGVKKNSVLRLCDVVDTKRIMVKTLIASTWSTGEHSNIHIQRVEHYTVNGGGHKKKKMSPTGTFSESLW